MFDARAHICCLEGFVVWKVLLFTHAAAIHQPGAVDVRRAVSRFSVCQGTIGDRIPTNNVISHSHLFQQIILGMTEFFPENAAAT